MQWKEVADELEQAPDYFLQAANKLWRNKLATKQQQLPQKVGEDTRKDSEQQARWEAKYDSTREQLLYFGEFTDKGEHIRLLQHARVVNHTPKQIHIVAAYTLYGSKVPNNSNHVVWSTKSDGGLFRDFYSAWEPVTRYRLRRIPKANLFNPDVLIIPRGGASEQERNARILAMKRLCSVCLFANEDEYAKWHLVRFEDTLQKMETPSVYRGDIMDWVKRNLDTLEC